MPETLPVYNKKIQVVVAHPEDAEVFCGGTIANSVQAVKLNEPLAVDAILQHSNWLAIHALISHPLVSSFTRLTKPVGEYLHAHTAYIGEWRDHARQTSCE